jgi:hypothetical protein
MSYRTKQAERGKEAVHSLASFLENTFGNLHISIHEAGYSSGEYGSPDIVFREFGIEVKRIEFLAKERYKGEEYPARLNTLKINSFEWRLQKEWCKLNKKQHVFIVVLTWGDQTPIYVGFTEEQIDGFRERCKHRRSAQRESSEEYRKAFCFGVNSLDVLKEGMVLNNPDFLCRFFDAIPENEAQITT